MNLKYFITLLSIPLILFSCAQVVPLSGGEKDVLPPKEVESIPKNGSISFAHKTITIEFDEYIKLTNITSQLIVSPLMETPPEILVKGKKIVIKLEDELAENTTYSLNFGNAITDITENNVIPNYKYVFSTGSYIDSLSYSGKVVNAFDLSNKETIYVLLYDQLEDSVPLKELPRYVALTDKEGKFSITNIAHGIYKLFANNDINGNYIYDLPTEEIAFIDDDVTIDSSSSENLIYLFQEENELQYLDKAENKKYGKVDIVLNKSTKNLITTPLTHSQQHKYYIEEKNANGDSLILWLIATEGIENLKLVIKDGSGIIDTTAIGIIPKSEFKDSILDITTNLSPVFDLNKGISIVAERPVIEAAIDNIKLYEGSSEIEFLIEKYEPSSRAYLIKHKLKENTNYQLLIPAGVFKDIYGLKNDTVKAVFRTKNESDYGIINLKVTPNFSESYIIQLFKNDKLIKESHLKSEVKIDYEYLLPGDYELKLIIDSNGDKKWNTGNYLDHIQPEKVIFYEKEIKIRANWNNDIIWTINE